MGFFSDILKGLSGTPASPPGNRIPSLLGQLGWSVDERVGTNGILLNFRDPAMPGGVRQVMVTHGDGERIAILSVFSAARFRPDGVPPHLGSYLLLRNKEVIVAAWAMTEIDGRVGFVASYTALMGGLDANTFKYICETLVKEASAMDAGLRSKGLL